jgi:hypothetical protein
MAATHFTEGIKVYQKYKDLCHTNSDCITKVTQLYTNRALAWHSINNQTDAFDDSEYVLNNIDQNNTKALYRRSYFYKLKHQYGLAVQDLTLLAKLDPKNTQCKKDLTLL